MNYFSRYLAGLHQANSSAVLPSSRSKGHGILRGLKDIEEAVKNGFDFADRKEEAQILYFLKKDLEADPVKAVSEDQYKAYNAMIDGLSGKSHDMRVLAALINPELNDGQDHFTPEDLEALRTKLRDNMVRTEFTKMLQEMDKSPDLAIYSLVDFNRILIVQDIGVILYENNKGSWPRWETGNVISYNSEIQATLGLSAEQYDDLIMGIIKKDLQILADENTVISTREGFFDESRYHGTPAYMNFAKRYIARRDGLDLEDPIHQEQIGQELLSLTGFSDESIRA
jgi:hypothetical protein